MKIGILTFHWSDNYGAVLQSYALQEFLKNQGHDVDIINYTPLKYSLFYTKFLLHPKQFLNFRKVRIQKQKHSLLNQFRKVKLNLTHRIFHYSNINAIADKYDVIISGSDQVLNSSFLLYGEKGKTPVYYLPFSTPKKLGYAVSFGCVSYPENVKEYAATLVNNFDCIGVRENTGQHVLSQLGYHKKVEIVPDPTILYGNHLYDNLTLSKEYNDYYCVYVLRSNITLECTDNVIYLDDTKKPVTMEQWVSIIKFSKGLITNSYHGMIMAILNHVPFCVILEQGEISGMNDRFYTLLNKLGLEDRVFEEYDRNIISYIANDINWTIIDNKLAEYRRIGETFLLHALS